MGIEREISREIMQKRRAIANGALVRPPRNLAELEADEAANAAEIDHLEERRASLYRQLGGSLPERVRSDLSHDLDACSRSLDLAFAARRRLRVARDLYHQGVFV